jgi:nucleoid DNA-binding protein
MAKKAAPKAADAKAAAPAGKASPAAAKSSERARAKTKTELYGELAEKAGLSKKDVAKVFDAMTELVNKELGKKGPGLFVIPGLIKLKRVHKAATKARPGFNPATKEPITIKAKPARTVIKAQPLKALKDTV